MSGLKYLMLFGVLGVSSAALRGTYERGLWKVYCDWAPADPKALLQNVTIARNDQEIVVYKPADHPSSPLIVNVTANDAEINVNCNSTAAAGQQGLCVLLVSIKGEAKADKYSCLITFGPPNREKQANIVTIIDEAGKPTIRETQSSGQRQVLNCSAEGVPPPSLVWTAPGSGQDKKVISPDFNNTVWNATTKVWVSWSVYKPLPNTSFSRVYCTPQQLQGDKLVYGTEESHNVRSAGWINKTSFLALLVSFLMHMSL